MEVNHSNPYADFVELDWKDYLLVAGGLVFFGIVVGVTIAVVPG